MGQQRKIWIAAIDAELNKSIDNQMHFILFYIILFIFLNLICNDSFCVVCVFFVFFFFIFVFLLFCFIGKISISLLFYVATSSSAAWSLANFSTIFFTYVSCRESGLPITSSTLYGGFIVTSLNTTIFGPRQVTYIWIYRKENEFKF